LGQPTKAKSSNRGFRHPNEQRQSAHTKGGLRFTPNSQHEHTQILAFRTSLQELTNNSANGGAKADQTLIQKAKATLKLMRFCQAFMTELQRHIGTKHRRTSSDIGVGGKNRLHVRPIKKLRTRIHRRLNRQKPSTGADPWIRPESHRLCCTLLRDEMLKTRKESIQGKIVCIQARATLPNTQ